MPLSIQAYQGKKINVLVVVNTDGVAADPNNFGRYVRMVDDQRNDPGQFGNELTVTCHPSDTLIFRVCAVKPDADVQLIQFVHTGGDHLLGNLSYNPNILAWQGTITQTGYEVYHWQVKINNKIYDWDPFIQATNAPISIER